MNYTTNYHLPQWVEEDRIMMTDFNEAMESIEEGLSAVKATADSAYSTSNKPMKTGTVNLSADKVGTAVATFPFNPTAIVITGFNSETTLLLRGRSAVLTTLVGAAGSCELTLNNSKLTLDSYSNGSPQIYYIAFA